jgi:hypothetical protein
LRREDVAPTVATSRAAERRHFAVHGLRSPSSRTTKHLIFFSFAFLAGLALPRVGSISSENKALIRGLGKSAVIENKGVSASAPKPYAQKETAAPAGPRNGGKYRGNNVAIATSRRRASLSIAAELRGLARDLRRIRDPMRASPEAVFAARNEIAGRMFALAAEMEADHG